MTHKNKITVKINGDKSTGMNEDSFPNRSAWFEQAASLEDDEREEIDLLEKDQSTDYSMPQKRKKSKINSSNLKLFALTACCAIIIAVGFGFIMLKMFVEIDNQNALPSNATTTSQTTDSTESTTTPVVTDSQETDLAIPALQAFVLQLGVFSDQLKAEEWQEKVKNSGQESMIWEIDGEFRLFAGVSSTKKEAKFQAQLLQESGQDIYVREWKTSEKTIEVNAEVAEWLQSFSPLWVETTAGNLNDQEWEEWLNTAPEGLSDPLLALKGKTKTMYDLLVTQAKQDQLIQVRLLEMWYLYQNL
ncbi:hypothetical protein GCM10011351_11430 [Paraliobacillus quinghaiensis]|uniref:SPOR domain-containing protein n=1 Tax=Paraliobacillus quinghaiensis TaxID=470815 RepID=A0A917TLU7_9BACI|nr:SPOR domain-containing protein [Paraliobacillus quinghaiensis]GGM27318.1 hypothetical protein GCM10011351_11430 [Paraliobacillus quinghaiensis]